MSSAALQGPPLQPTSLPALNSHGSGQYTPNSSPSREGYYARENTNAASPSSSKRPSRRPSGNTAAANSPMSNHPERTQASPMTSRTALASPVPVAGGDHTPSTSTSSRRRHEPPVAPPRTSSNHQSGSGATPSRRAARAEERAANSPRRPATTESSRDAPNGYDESNSRRRAAQQDPPQRGSSSKEARQTATTTIPIRTTTNTSHKQPSHEASEILNQVLVSQPEVDIEREQERLEEAQPHHVTSSRDDYDDAVPPPVATSKEVADETSGKRRSRHDYSKREKGSKFGDYYLGNTIGEGEFGKVKLGWKQDGGVQVCPP
jgi:protein-serine/threonine kinase